MRACSFRIVCGQVHKHTDAPHPLGLLRPRRERPRGRPAAEQRDELAPLYPNHVIPRAYAVWVRLKRTLAALAYFAQCLGRRFLVVGAQHDRSRTRAAVPQLGRGHR